MEKRDLAPTVIRLYDWQRVKANKRVEQLKLRSLSEYIRHLIANDNNK